MSSPARDTAVRTAVALGLVAGLSLTVSGCGGGGGGSAAPATTTPAGGTTPPGGTDVPEGGPVLLVEYTGGFTMPQVLAGRLPLVAVYADGRVITEGPVAAIYPGPALPNLQVHQVDPGTVRDWVDQAVAAGVGEEIDYGRPGLADAPSTRFTVVTGDGTRTTEVYALSEALAPGPGDEPLPGLTEEQVAARAELQQLLADLDGTDGAATEAYQPEAVAAVVSDWTDVDDGLPPPEPVAWPGPPLPGEELDERLGVSCVTARAEAADAVLEAAGSATAVTPWTAADGERWSLLLRPLLPHENGCADLAVDRVTD